jgi:hypothetical protein
MRWASVVVMQLNRTTIKFQTYDINLSLGTGYRRMLAHDQRLNSLNGGLSQ